MSPYQRIIDALEAHGSRRGPSGTWTCPSHQDRNPSLSVAEGREGRVVLHCHAGCSFDQVMEALDLGAEDAFGERAHGNGAVRQPIVATYPYLDEGGTLLYEVVRYAPKDFRQRRPDPESPGDWLWNLKGTRRVIYRLPQAIEAVRAGRPVYIVEGEKDVHAIEAAGAVATCNAGGAGKWRPEYVEHFRGADVRVVADNDEAGARHQEAVVSSLAGVARSVKRLAPAAGKDAADHLGEGLALDAFVDLDARPRKTVYRSGADVLAAAPETTPWLWQGYVAEGAVTLLAGRHKGGKSTMLFGLMRAVLDGYTDFLGHEVVGGPVVLLTEEAPGTLRDKLALISAGGLGRLRVLCRDDVTPRVADWAESVSEAGLEAEGHGAKLVVIDTFAFWSLITDENDAAVMQQAMAAIGTLTARGLSVVVVHHHRKGGGESGDAIRGSSAMQGAVDVIVELVRPPAENEDDEDTNERELRAIGRYPGIPEAMRVRLDGDGIYRRIAEGTRRDVKAQSASGQVLEYLKERFPDTPRTSDIRDATGFAKQTVLGALRYLVGQGVAESFPDHEHRQALRYRWVDNDAPTPDLDPFGDPL